MFQLRGAATAWVIMPPWVIASLGVACMWACDQAVCQCCYCVCAYTGVGHCTFQKQLLCGSPCRLLVCVCACGHVKAERAWVVPEHVWAWESEPYRRVPKEARELRPDAPSIRTSGCQAFRQFIEHVIEVISIPRIRQAQELLDPKSTQHSILLLYPCH